jgi:hypothetical protein
VVVQGELDDAAGVARAVAGADAVISHLRVGDTKGVAMPLLPLVLAAAVLVLRLATL